MTGTGHRRGLGRRAAAATVTAASALLLACAPQAQAANGGFITVFDNSHADSVLEVDRTANVESGGGTAGSDHDGSAVDLMDTLINPDPAGDGSDEG
ncbi:hypothetical protein [uncultured Streptomyces sp.]|uniref:hypothetical protein n=1 Tax=uncultured Streptomyces sp. TaxID=174707 RepID=UPI002624CA29|nr:hypothetical protein [uncultured Streptomyces sp.]